MDEHETKDVKTTPTSEDKSAPLVTGVKGAENAAPLHVHTQRDPGDEDKTDG
jgi:hypothetical protein